MRRFWFFLYALTAIAHVPFALGASYALGRAGAPVPGVFGVALACGLALLLKGRIGRARADRHIPRWKALLVEEPYYAHWCGSIVATIALVPAALVAGAFSLLHVGAAPIGAVALGCYAVGFGVAAWGVFVRTRWVRVRTLDVPIPGLPPAFEGYRIAQLSDLHIGSLCPRERAEGWRDRVNDLAVDLVALTGDYVTSGVAFHRDIAAALTGFAARDGAVAVMGNHDYFGDGEPLITLLREGGVVVLRNEHLTIERQGEQLVVAGVDDTWTRRADVERALASRDERLPLIALSHDPKLFPELARRGASLVLSGHTHWGQIGIPFFERRWNLSRLSFRYHSGLYRENGATLYVNPGLGTTGPPVRLGAAPEITVMQLRAASTPAG